MKKESLEVFSSWPAWPDFDFAHSPLSDNNSFTKSRKYINLSLILYVSAGSRFDQSFCSWTLHCIPAGSPNTASALTYLWHHPISVCWPTCDVMITGPPYSVLSDLPVMSSLLALQTTSYLTYLWCHHFWPSKQHLIWPTCDVITSGPPNIIGIASWQLGNREGNAPLVAQLVKAIDTFLIKQFTLYSDELYWILLWNNIKYK